MTQYFPVFEPSNLRELKTFLARCSFEVLFRAKGNHYRVAVIVLVITKDFKKHSSSQNPASAPRVSLGSADGQHPGLRKGDIVESRTTTSDSGLFFFID